MSRPISARLADMAQECRCGHDRAGHYFSGECQKWACSCRVFGLPLDNPDVASAVEDGYVSLGDIHAGLSLWHCVACSAVVEKTARSEHDRWHASLPS